MALLSDMQVDAKPQGDDTILVVDDQIDTVRMQLAAQGYPNSGVNFDIFKNASGLGVTDMEKRVYYQYQLEENLRTTIRKMDKVEDAVVNINLAKESSFVLSDDDKPATAAVTLMLVGNTMLSNNEVKAIAELVSKSVSGLQLDGVRIIDTQMNLYNINGEDEAGNVTSQMQLQQSVQKRLQAQIINLLNPVFGEGNVLAEVNVKLNFDTKITESVEFSPPADGTEGLVISMKELTETIKNNDAANVAGIDANGGASQYVSTDDTDATYQNISKEANYEINETKMQIEDAKGQIDDLSVSIVLNSADNLADYTDSVIQLVANAIGVDVDKITVQMLPFIEIEESTDAQDAFVVQQQLVNDVSNASTLRLVIITVAALIVMIFLFIIIRMFLPKRNHGTGDDSEWEEGTELYADEELVPNAQAAASGYENGEIVFDKKDNNLSILEEYISKDSESVANLLRNWLNEE